MISYFGLFYQGMQMLLRICSNVPLLLTRLSCSFAITCEDFWWDAKLFFWINLVNVLLLILLSPSVDLLNAFDDWHDILKLLLIYLFFATNLFQYQTTKPRSVCLTIFLFLFAMVLCEKLPLNDWQCHIPSVTFLFFLWLYFLCF